MALREMKLLHSYLRLYQVFPEDIHIARPLIQMLQQMGRVKEARGISLSMARKMLAIGNPGFALAFLTICKQLEHPNRQEIEALTHIAEITIGAGAQDDEGVSGARLFDLIARLSDSEAMDFITQAAFVKAQPGENIVTQGDDSETMYLILDGEVDVHVTAADGSDTLIKQLVPGEFFGEFACVYNLKRWATVTARTPAMLLEFSGKSISELMKRFPLAGDYLIQTVQTRMVHILTHSLPAFSELPEEDKQWLIDESGIGEFQVGDEIPAATLSSSPCHIIISGEAELASDGTRLPLTIGNMIGSASPHIKPPSDSTLKVKGHLLTCMVPEKIFRTFMNVYHSFEKHVKHEGELRKAFRVV